MSLTIYDDSLRKTLRGILESLDEELSESYGTGCSEIRIADVGVVGVRRKTFSKEYYYDITINGINYNRRTSELKTLKEWFRDLLRSIHAI